MSTDTARFDRHTSARIKSFLRASYEKCHSSARQISADVGGRIHSKTLSAILLPDDKRRLKVVDAQLLVEDATRRQHLRFDPVWHRLVDGVSSGLPWLDELPALSYWQLSHRSAPAALTPLRAAIHSSSVVSVVARMRLGGLAPINLSKALVKIVHGSHATPTALAGLRRYESLLHGHWLSVLRKKDQHLRVCMAEEDLVRLLRHEVPYDRVPADATMEFKALLADDWLKNSCFRLHLLARFPNSAEWQWLHNFAAVTAIGSQLMVRQPLSRPYVITSQAPTENVAQIALHERLDMLNRVFEQSDLARPLDRRTFVRLVDSHKH